MVKKGYKQTEEHKRKIGLANSISLKGKHISKETEFKKNATPWNKGKDCPQLQEEKHGAWKGGSHSTAKRIALRNKKDLTNCQICNSKKNINIHHIDGNPKNNNPKNLGIICCFCHNAMHDNKNRIANRFGRKSYGI